MFAIIGAVLFGVVAILTLLVALGLPYGAFTMGGRYRVLPPAMRAVAGVSFVKGACYAFAAYLAINTVMNFLSSSKKEKLWMTPLSLAACICFFLAANAI